MTYESPLDTNDEDEDEHGWGKNATLVVGGESHDIESISIDTNGVDDEAGDCGDPIGRIGPPESDTEDDTVEIWTPDTSTYTPDEPDDDIIDAIKLYSLGHSTSYEHDEVTHEITLELPENGDNREFIERLRKVSEDCRLNGPPGDY